MKRWIAFAAGMYPRSWRDEFGEEFSALLEDIKPGWRVFANVLGGAVRMQITTGTNWLKLVAATAVFGAIVAVGASFSVAPHYVSTTVMSITPQADPVRPTSSQALEQRAAARIMQVRNEVLSRTSLSSIITDPRLDLYKSERQGKPLEDVIEEMRQNIRIQTRTSTDVGLSPLVFSISYADTDQAKAQKVVRELASRFAETNAVADRDQGNMYQSFWNDMSVAQHTKPPPPPPVGEIVAVVDPASLPKISAGPNRIVFLAWGIGAGLMLGLLAALATRRPREAWQLSACAAAGFVIAGAASFLIPNTYISEAVMRITPAAIMEDPLTPLPTATPAAEFLRETEPQVLSFQSLSAIITDPRLDLYSAERSREPLEDVVRNIRDRDLRIAIVSSALGTNGTVSAFSISFSYSNPHKAQQFVQTLMTRFHELHLTRQRESVRGPTLNQIFQRKASENLDVIDSPSLPERPSKPNRLLIAALGFGIGLLLGAITLFLRRPRTPILQPA